MADMTDFRRVADDVQLNVGMLLDNLLHGFGDEMDALALVDGANEGELKPLKSIPIECWRAKAGSDVARTLALEPGAPIIIVRRLLRFGNEPAVFDEIYLPGDLFADLTLDVLKAGGMSLYSLFETKFGVRMIRADERLRAVSADRLSSGLLQVPEGSPLLLVERVTFTYADKPVEWRRGFYSTQHFHYHNELG